MLQQGRARDLLTLDDVRHPALLAEDRFTARLTPTRQILEISAIPPRADIVGLVGSRAGGQLRRGINDALPQERAQGTPLYLLLDDIAGSSLVAAWAWSHWDPEWREPVSDAETKALRPTMEGVCIGFRPGSPALIDGVPGPDQNFRHVDSLDVVDDPHGWHVLTPQQGVSARRARRIDVRIDGGCGRILIGAHFQDSAPLPSGERVAVHEYMLEAVADADSMTLLSIRADPRILPYDQCPMAILNIGRLAGTPLAELRDEVLARLARTEGCTHLNDMARSLAEVPQMAAALRVALMG